MVVSMPDEEVGCPVGDELRNVAGSAGLLHSATAMGEQLFEDFENAIRALPSGDLTESDLLTETFLLREEGKVAVYYVPFEGINEDARVVLVGITPGFTQMRIAFEAVRDTLLRGASSEEAFAAAQQDASFAGSMRINLNRMLDEVGLPEMLGIDRTEELFSTRSDLLHSTSALRNPVFVAGRNYTGSSPKIRRSPVLKKTVIEGLGPELRKVPRAIVIPLGLAVEGALQVLVERGDLDPARCCLGFPHPSGANGHRKRIFEENRETIAAELGGWFSDQP
jgi:hypothetical protein